MSTEHQSCREEHKKLFIEKALNKEAFSSNKLPADASFRKYERIVSPKGNFILMDAFLDKSSIAPFTLVAEFLQKKGYSAPKILAKAEDLGLLLLEDLGETSYSSVLANSDQESLKETERMLYKKAIDLLIDLHHNTATHEIEIPSYDKELLLNEALLLVDWYLPALTGSKLPEDLRQGYIQAWEKIFSCLHYFEDCLVLRDYHIDNLIWMEDRDGVKKIGLLDFQDAVKGSYAYDVVSLLEDARRDVNEELAQELFEYYVRKLNKLDRRKFLSDYKILGVQRSCKILGIFARKAARDNDARYIKHLPRVLNYVKRHINHPILEPLKIWFQAVDIPSMKNRI